MPESVSRPATGSQYQLLPSAPAERSQITLQYEVVKYYPISQLLSTSTPHPSFPMTHHHKTTINQIIDALSAHTAEDSVSFVLPTLSHIQRKDILEMEDIRSIHSVLGRLDDSLRYFENEEGGDQDKVDLFDMVQGLSRDLLGGVPNPRLTSMVYIYYNVTPHQTTPTGLGASIANDGPLPDIHQAIQSHIITIQSIISSFKGHDLSTSPEAPTTSPPISIPMTYNFRFNCQQIISRFSDHSDAAGARYDVPIFDSIQQKDVLSLEDVGELHGVLSRLRSEFCDYSAMPDEETKTKAMIWGRTMQDLEAPLNKGHTFSLKVSLKTLNSLATLLSHPTLLPILQAAAARRSHLFPKANFETGLDNEPSWSDHGWETGKRRIRDDLLPNVLTALHTNMKVIQAILSSSQKYDLALYSKTSSTPPQIPMTYDFQNTLQYIISLFAAHSDAASIKFAIPILKAVQTKDMLDMEDVGQLHQALGRLESEYEAFHVADWWPKDAFIDDFHFNDGEGPDEVLSRLMERLAQDNLGHLITLHLPPSGCTVAEELSRLRSQ
ncbi:hypothetical protein L198_07422 [Cryptococcus wingfieldii CBS 7118]|uniref:Uncharacterized protein n=1 Tax=Cryptococcus wingfieldii CBS 7118 TaxID=1295528 RepID=A0A1E3IBK9_9TREE|nr:hypothetical protein L198_07422 [Cryptococcus wingfieldii CBS 7118]ODN85858.1 hypothetical protein L198_07422 [Cryptococcus wingfieldii CBS 7118]